MDGNGKVLGSGSSGSSSSSSSGGGGSSGDAGASAGPGNQGRGDAPFDAGEERRDRMNLLMALFRRSGVAKIPGVLDHLGRFLTTLPTARLVFAHHTAVLNAVAKFCRQREEDYIRIDGSTSAEERLNLAHKFQKQSSVRVAVLAITAAGISL